MPKAPPATKAPRRAQHLADALRTNNTAGTYLHAINLRAIGNDDPLKATIREARDLQAKLSELLVKAIREDAAGLSR